MLSEDPSFADAAYQPMAPVLPFLLAPRAGPAVATLYAKFRDAAQNESVAVHDSILLDMAGDSDNDGLPDDWEIRYFGDLRMTPADDPDGDGLTNGEELRQGTDPTDPRSPRRGGVLSLRHLGRDLLIEFHGTLRSADRVEGPYLPVSEARSPYRVRLGPGNRFFLAD